MVNIIEKSRGGQRLRDVLYGKLNQDCLELKMMLAYTQCWASYFEKEINYSY